jgi:hypothetical protein
MTHRTFATLALLALALLVAGAPAALAADASWTGEVLDLACYAAQGAHGPDHASCAKSCTQGGQPVGLLTDDGAVVVLAADHENGAAFETVKGLAGSKAEVTGTLAEKAGIKVVTVKSAKAVP